MTHRFAGGGGELGAWFLPCDRKAGLVLMFHGYASYKSELLGEAAAFHELGFEGLCHESYVARDRQRWMLTVRQFLDRVENQ